MPYQRSAHVQPRRFEAHPVYLSDVDRPSRTLSSRRHQLHAKTPRSLLLLALLLSSFGASADADALVKSIKSVEAVKKEVKAAIFSQCGTGGCADSEAEDICDFAAALDVKVGYQISKSQAAHGSPKSELPIKAKDLELFQLIYSQCRPSSYQYWNRDRMLHVVYDPTPEVASRVREALTERSK